MSDFDIDGYLAKAARTAPKTKGGDFDIDAYLAKQTKAAPAEPGTPLERALREQTGDVVTVETPTGPTQFTRDGSPFFGPAEAEQMQAAGAARFKERALEGGLSFLSGGGPLVDEMAGAAKALSVDALGKNLGEVYRQGRDQARGDVASATRNASPEVDVAGVKMPLLPALGSAVPSLVAPLPSAWMGRILSGGAQGALSAGGASEADLTRGQAGEFARDVGVGGGTGLAASALAEGIAAPFRGVGRAATAEAGAADDAARAAVQAAKDKAVAQAQGKLGGIAAGQGNSMETLIDVLRNPHLHHPDSVAAAMAYKATPEGEEMIKRAVLNNIEKLQESAPREAAARLALGDAKVAAQPAAVGAAAASKLEPLAILDDMAKKSWRSVGQRAAMGAAGSAVGAGISAARGGEARDGALIGAASGWATPGTLQFLRNQAGSPVVQSGANRLVSALMNATSKGATTVAPLAAPVADQRNHSRLSRAYRAMMEKYGLEEPARP